MHQAIQLFKSIATELYRSQKTNYTYEQICLMVLETKYGDIGECTQEEIAYIFSTTPSLIQASLIRAVGSRVDGTLQKKGKLHNPGFYIAMKSMNQSNTFLPEREAYDNTLISTGEKIC